ncbi:MAG TPA: 2-C-methyl-D-erythritol 2,4-cyclodiphosphate synthase [Fimbriimonadaceae bacterium]
MVAAILAAGKGTRFGGDKTRMILRGKPVWRHSFDTFLAHPLVDAVGLICSASLVEEFRREAPSALFVAAGGDIRQDSAAAALAYALNADVLLIHDGARPFVSSAVIDRVLAGIERCGAAAPAVSVTDTVRSRGGDLLDRDQLLAMQTPQGARVSLLQEAFTHATGSFTDEVALLKSAGIEAEIVEGDKRNIKITTPEDLHYAAAVLGQPETRTGIGYDVHPFSTDPDRKLYLGGVLFEGAPALEGHSDADVLLHAVTDALLGAAALGDIGQHFPNTDPAFKDKSSIYFLEHAGLLLESQKWRILNIDATVIAEFPKLMTQATTIRERIAGALGLSHDRVSIKATTNERLGSIGRGEGIAAFAVATISESA